jgi:hypothetical protein
MQLDIISLFILSFFKQKNNDYSFMELASLLGLPISVIDEKLGWLIDLNYLKYNQVNLLSLTSKGRVTLAKTEMENFSFNQNKIHPEILKNEPWPLDKIYIPKGFTKKIQDL